MHLLSFTTVSFICQKYTYNHDMIWIKLEHIIFKKEPVVITRSRKGYFILIFHDITCIDDLFKAFGVNFHKLKMNVLEIFYFSKMIVVIFEVRQLQLIAISKIKCTFSRNSYSQQFFREVNLIFYRVFCLPFFNY